MIVRVLLDRIQDNPYQSRLAYPQESIAELARAILASRESYPDTSGLIQVPTGRAVDAGGELVPAEDFPGNIAGDVQIQLAAGHRRLRAFQMLVHGDPGQYLEACDEYATMPVRLANLDDAAMARTVRQENADREDVSPIEEALLFQSVQARLGWSQNRIGQEFALSQSAVANKLRLLGLPENIRALIHDGTITEKHGRTLLPLLQVPGALQKRLLFDGQNIRPTAELERIVRDEIDRRTRVLPDASWRPVDEWVPTDPSDEVVGACGECPHAETILRRRRCLQPSCFEAKDLAYRWQVEGPEKARELHADATGWKLNEGKVLNWRVCRACSVQASNHPEKLGWYRNREQHICPTCWHGAGLPEPEPEGEQVLAQAAAVPGVDLQPVSPEPARPAPELQPIEAPPPPPAAVLLTLRILPGEELPARRVMAAIAEEGSPPAAMRSGDYAAIGDLVREICQTYFSTNGTEEV